MSEGPVAAEMRIAAQRFLGSLDDERRGAATTTFDARDHREWTYLPGPRPGLALADMSPTQRDLVMQLLATGLSERGLTDARAIMWLEGVLRALEQSVGKSGWQRRDPGHFWVRVLGHPASGRPWAWRVNGHHLAVHMTVVRDRIAATPQFFGANPAVVPSGPRAGHRTLPMEEDLARELLAGLPPSLRQRAIVNGEAPPDILTRRDPLVYRSQVPVGLRYVDMDGASRRALTALVGLYVGRTVPAVADSAWARIHSAELDQIAFAWAGGEERGLGHYYAVSGPTFVIEYDNTQNNANHVHTVWRDLTNDWGLDLLAEHHRAEHR